MYSSQCRETIDFYAKQMYETTNVWKFCNHIGTSKHLWFFLDGCLVYGEFYRKFRMKCFEYPFWISLRVPVYARIRLTKYTYRLSEQKSSKYSSKIGHYQLWLKQIENQILPKKKYNGQIWTSCPLVEKTGNEKSVNLDILCVRHYWTILKS